MKKFLLATAAVLASTSAYAADYAVVHPFYTPAQGKFVSTTAFEYEHTNTHMFKDDFGRLKGSDKTFSEAVEFGVTDDIQVGLSASRTWDKMKLYDETGFMAPDGGKEYINQWKLSAGYNVINDGKTFLNVGLNYSQTVSKDGNRDPMDPEEHDMHGKYIGIEVLGGYNFDDFTAFGGIGFDRQVDINEKEVEKSKDYTLEAGVFKAFNDQISAQTSLAVEFDMTKGGKERNYWWNVGADYSISKKMTVGLNAAYLLRNDIREKESKGDELHRAYRIGMDFTIEF